VLGATEDVLGEVKPYSISGSLPLVRWMQDNGFDVQIVGYGLSSRYHAENEYCQLSDMVKAVQIMSKILLRLEETA
jgi:acetylornithine deacetylase